MSSRHATHHSLTCQAIVSLGHVGLRLSYKATGVHRQQVVAYAVVLAGQRVYDLSDSSAMKPATLRTPAASACCCCSYTAGSTEATSRRSSTAWQAIVHDKLNRSIWCAQLDGYKGLCAACACNAAAVIVSCSSGLSTARLILVCRLGAASCVPCLDDNMSAQSLCVSTLLHSVPAKAT